jgi:hypothetical protein
LVVTTGEYGDTFQRTRERWAEALESSAGIVEVLAAFVLPLFLEASKTWLRNRPLREGL